MNLTFSQNKIVHSLFKITIFIKGISGLLEIAVGLLFSFFSRETLYRGMTMVTGNTPRTGYSHFATNYLIRQENNFSVNTKYFVAFYFLFYGVVNIFLVISLLKGKLWAYPTAILFFSLFTMYLALRSFTHHSLFLFFLTLFDIFLIVLTWFEYQRVKQAADQTVL